MHKQAKLNFYLPGKNGTKTELLAQIPVFDGIMIEALPL